MSYLKLFMVFLFIITFPLKAQKHPFGAYFEKSLSKAELIEDLEILEKGLEKIHPSLYQYISKKELKALFEAFHQGLHSTLQLQAFYQKVSALVAQVKCQHTIATPPNQLLYKIEKKGKFFPLRIFWEFNPVRTYVAFDFSKEASLAPHTEVLSINGKSMQAIHDELMPYFPSDGGIVSNQRNRLQFGVDFQVWYYLLMDRSDNFVVELVDRAGKTFTKSYEAVTFKQWTRNYKRYLSQKEPTIRRYTDYYAEKEKLNRKKPLRYKYLSDSIAMLTVWNFSDFNQFDAVIPAAFKDFSDKNIKHLVIDVRYNGGGSDILGRRLFSYLIDRPTPYFDSLYSSTGISDTTFLFTYTDKNREWYHYTLPLVNRLPDGRYATKPSVNEGLKIQTPNKHHFKGQVYILMNGRSASTTAEFLAASHFHQLAIFIGEESGGAYHGGNGGDFAQLSLPHSKIQVQIPLSHYVMNSSEKRFKGQGTLPDYPIELIFSDFIQLKDQELEKVLELIRAEK